MRAPDLPDDDQGFAYLDNSFPDDASRCGTTNLHRRPKKTKASAAAQFAARRPATASMARSVNQLSSSAMPTAAKPHQQQQQQQKQQPVQVQQPRVLKPRQALLRLERRLSRRPDPDADTFTSPWALRQRARALDALLAPASAAGNSRSSTASGGSCQLYGVWERVPTSASPEEATSSSGNGTTVATSTTTTVSNVRCRTAVTRTTTGCGANNSAGSCDTSAASGANEQRGDLRPVSCYGNRRARPVMTLVDFVASASVRVQNFSFPTESSSAQQQRQQRTTLRPVRRPAGFDRCCVSSAAEDSGDTPASGMPRQRRLAAALAISGLKS